MNYAKIYESLIERGKNRICTGYTEKHHIVPRCLGGSDNKDNIVVLTPEEHYVAHQLLVKMYPGNHRIAKAASMMIVNRPSNKLYGWLRKRHCLAMKELQGGESNSQFGSFWIHNLELQENRKTSGEIPEGWIKGRVVDFAAREKRAADKAAQQEEKQRAAEAHARKWYEEFKRSNAVSIREFVKSSEYKSSHVSFIKMLKKYVPEFEPKHGTGYIPR